MAAIALSVDAMTAVLVSPYLPAKAGMKVFAFPDFIY